MWSSGFDSPKIPVVGRDDPADLRFKVGATRERPLAQAIEAVGVLCVADNCRRKVALAIDRDQFARPFSARGRRRYRVLPVYPVGVTRVLRDSTRHCRRTGRHRGRDHRNNHGRDLSPDGTKHDIPCPRTIYWPSVGRVRAAEIVITLHRLPGGSHDADGVERWLRDRGASERGYMMSASGGAGDGGWRPVGEAMEDGYDCTVVSCLPGVLAYYREEGDRRPVAAVPRLWLTAGHSRSSLPSLQVMVVSVGGLTYKQSLCVRTGDRAQLIPRESRRLKVRGGDGILAREVASE